MLFAFATMKELQKKSYRLTLWIYREGKRLEDAVKFCSDNGVEFFAVNKNYPAETKEGKHSNESGVK